MNGSEKGGPMALTRQRSAVVGDPGMIFFRQKAERGTL